MISGGAAAATAGPTHELTALVRSVLHSPDYRPPLLPAAAMEVHRLSMQSRVDFDAVVSVLERDQVLAGDVLRVAQSPMYARRVLPASLDEAVARLGLSNLRDIVFRVAFGAKVFRTPAYKDVMESIRDHSAATAQVARLLGKGTPVAGHAFLSGLLHDVGAAAIVLALAETKRDVDPESLVELIEELHEEAGLLLLEAWELPEQLRAAVSAHHCPTTQEGALVLIANAVASELGHGMSIGGRSVEQPSEDTIGRACSVLGIPEERLQQLERESRSLLDG